MCMYYCACSSFTIIIAFINVYTFFESWNFLMLLGGRFPLVILVLSEYASKGMSDIDIILLL